MLDFGEEIVDQGLGVGEPIGTARTGDGREDCASQLLGIAALHRMLRRAFQLSRTLPDAPLHVFENEIASLPQATQAERLVVRRVGQDERTQLV